MLNFDKFTQKNQEAIQRAFELVGQLEHQQIDADHLAYAMLKEENGIFASIFNQLGIDLGEFLAKCENQFEKKPTVQGGQQPFLSPSLNNINL